MEHALCQYGSEEQNLSGSSDVGGGNGWEVGMSGPPPCGAKSGSKVTGPVSGRG